MPVCRITKAGTILLPRCKLLYPALFEPTVIKGEKDLTRARYNTSALVPKSANLGILADEIAKLVAEKLTPAQLKTTKVKKPFIKTEDQPKVIAMLEGAGLDSENFPVIVRLAAKFKPTILAANMDVVNDEEQVYSGRWACVSVRPYFWSHPTGGNGVSLGLNNVQLLENDDVLAGGRIDAEDEFEPAEASAGGSAASTDSLFT